MLSCMSIERVQLKADDFALERLLREAPPKESIKSVQTDNRQAENERKGDANLSESFFNINLHNNQH